MMRTTRFSSGVLGSRTHNARATVLPRRPSAIEILLSNFPVQATSIFT
jgi:hypothetical protein